MTKAEALRVAKNYVEQYGWVKPSDWKVKSLEPENGKVVLGFFGVDYLDPDDEDAPFNYEVHISPESNEITLHRIEAVKKLNEYQKEPISVSKLKDGDTFRLKLDSVVWVFRGRYHTGNYTGYLISRLNKNDTQIIEDRVVFPL